MEMKKEHLPAYVSSRKVKIHYGVNEKILMSWVIKGYVRSLKLGNQRQSGRLYKIADVQEVLERLSNGDDPIILIEKKKNTPDPVRDTRA